MSKLQNYLYLSIAVSGPSSDDTSYADISAVIGDTNKRRDSALVLWTSANHPGATPYFEATFWVASGTGYHALFDSSNNQVTNSEISTTSTSIVRVRSSALTLSDGTQYKTRAKVSANPTTINLRDSKIVVNYDSTSFTALESSVVLSTSELDFIETTYTTSDPSSFYLYTSGNWSPAPSIYFEATMSNALTGTTYAQLYNFTDSSAVSSSEITTTSSSSTRVRSGSLTLTTAKDYTFQYKRATQNGQIAVARIVLIQSSSITKTELLAKTRTYQFTGNAGSYTSFSSLHYYEPSVWSYSSRSVYAEGTMRATGAVTGYMQLYNETAGAAITGSEISTSSTTRTRVRSGDIEANMPVVASTLRCQYKTSVATNVEFEETAHILYVLTISSGAVKDILGTGFIPFAR